MHCKGRPQVDALADRTLDVLTLALGIWYESAVVSTTHMSRQTGHVNEPFVTVGASFGFHIVSLLMPGQLLLRMKDFTTVTYIILELFLYIKMMTIFMLSEIRVTAERLVAKVAFDRCVTSMAVRVFVEFLLGEESFVADRAGEWLDTKVTLHVEFEVLLPIEILATLAALEGMDL